MNSFSVTRFPARGKKEKRGKIKSGVRQSGLFERSGFFPPYFYTFSYVCAGNGWSRASFFPRVPWGRNIIISIHTQREIRYFFPFGGESMGCVIRIIEYKKEEEEEEEEIFESVASCKNLDHVHCLKLASYFGVHAHSVFPHNCSDDFLRQKNTFIKPR